jgi:AcrR family transcriptional regulator
MVLSVKTLRADGVETRARLKAEAQRLFALRGIDGVSVQDIVSAAEQRNNASLRYYFGNKLELARELVVDGARIVDEIRQAMLDELEREGMLTLPSVMDALTLPLLELSERTGQATYIRMIANLQLNNRAFLREALADKWNTGYKRCFAHLAMLLPDIPAPILAQRLTLAGNIYGNAVWAAWESSRDSEDDSRFWARSYTISNVMDTLQGVLETPPSERTLALIDAQPASRKTASAGAKRQRKA